MKTNKEIESVEIFSGIIWQAEMVKSLLENVEIEAFLQDKIIGSLNLPWDAPGGMGLVKVVVAESDYEKAKLIVEEYKENLQKNK